MNAKNSYITRYNLGCGEFFDFMDKDTLINIIKNGKSPTQRFLIGYFPEGSEVSKAGIMNIYEKKSESQRRNPRKDKSRGCKKSVRTTRRHTGSQFFKKMIKIGFWKSTAH